MGQVRQGKAATKHAVTAAIRRSQVSRAQLGREVGSEEGRKTIRRRSVESFFRRTPGRWRSGASARQSRTSRPGRRSRAQRSCPRSRRRRSLPSDATRCCRSTIASIPRSRRSGIWPARRCTGACSDEPSMRNWFVPDGECIARLPGVAGDKPRRARFKRYPIGFLHIDIAEVQTAEGRHFLFVAIDHNRRFAVVQRVDNADRVGVPRAPNASRAGPYPHVPDRSSHWNAIGRGQ
jgi:hypothetical protein